jgi:hypothetical protein
METDDFLNDKALKKAVLETIENEIKKTIETKFHMKFEVKCEKPVITGNFNPDEVILYLIRKVAEKQMQLNWIEVEKRTK